MSAGCMFTDGIHVLAGLQKSTKLSGFGGKRLRGELPIDTAWRETLEELFYLPAGTITMFRDMIIERTTPVLAIDNNGYMCYVYTFRCLEHIMAMLRKYHPVSPLYRRFPTTIQELVFNRRIFTITEVGPLSIIPFVSRMSIDPDLKEDIRLSWTALNVRPN